MFDIGFGEMILLAAIALIAIGPKQLPEVARIVGRFMNEMKRMTSDFTSTIAETRNQAHTILQDTANKITNDLSFDHLSNPVSQNPPAHPQEQQSLHSQHGHGGHSAHDNHHAHSAHGHHGDHAHDAHHGHSAHHGHHENHGHHAHAESHPYPNHHHDHFHHDQQPENQQHAQAPAVDDASQMSFDLAAKKPERKDP